MPWADVSVWHGSPEDAVRLIEAVARHCDCLQLKRRCPAHDLMLDQHFIDHVLWLRFLWKEGDHA